MNPLNPMNTLTVYLLQHYIFFLPHLFFNNMFFSNEKNLRVLLFVNDYNYLWINSIRRKKWHNVCLLLILKL